MSDIQIDAIGDVRLGWGESARWDETMQRLYFVDCVAREFAWWDAAAPGLVNRVALATLPTAVYLTTDPDRVLVQLDDGLHAVIPSRGVASLAIANPPDEARFNDGVTDPAGAIVTGTLLFGVPGMPATGRYWRYAPPTGWTRLHEGKGNTNGPCVSADGRRLYIADTTACLIHRFDYQPSGALGDETVFADTRSLGGQPDGATLDAEGCLWSAIVGGSSLARYAPDGALKRVVNLPASHPTSVAFGGPNLDVLYVTTIGAAVLGIEPTGALSGAVLTVQGLGVKGVASARCPF